jgi:hypothetical protein
MNKEVLAQITEYDLNLHMQRLQMPFSNHPFYHPMVLVQNHWIQKILTAISLGNSCLHPEITLIHKNAESF